MKMNFSRVMRLLALRHRDQEAIVNIERNRRYSYEPTYILRGLTDLHITYTPIG